MVENAKNLVRNYHIQDEVMAQTFLKVQDRGMDDKKNERVNESSVLMKTTLGFY